jgi:hypothetical protein
MKRNKNEEKMVHYRVSLDAILIKRFPRALFAIEGAAKLG